MSAITKSDLISHSTRVVNTVWLDVNSDYSINGKPLLVADIESINNGIRNLFRCPIGSRGRSFQPRFGTYLYHLLQEPFDDQTAMKIRASTLQSLQLWESRIKVDYGLFSVTPNIQTSMYEVTIPYFYILNNQRYSTGFSVGRGS